MTKRIVNKSERNEERYNAKELYYKLYADSKNDKKFNHLMEMVISEQNIVLAYRNISKNSGSKTAGTDGLTIEDMQKYSIEYIVQKVRDKLLYYKPKKVRRVEIPKANGEKRPLGIPSIWDRLIQQCIFQVLEPICEAKFHERSNGFRPYRSPQNAIAQCYKMAQLQGLHYVVDIDIVGFFDNIDHSKLIKQMWGLGINDKKLLSIIKEMLKAEILFKDIVISPDTGTPQGGILSPLLSNIVLNELDWWIAKQWETFKVHEGISGLEFVKTDSRGNEIVDCSQKWRKLRKTTNLKEMYIVRYADDFKIFCRDYETAYKTMCATKLWIKETLHLNVNEEKSGITNLQKNYSTFLGIKFKVVPKGNKLVITSHIADNSKIRITENLRSRWREIINPKNEKDIDKNISLFNSAIAGMHNYYSMATMVSEDFAEIAYKVNGKKNGLNHNSRGVNISTTGKLNNKFIQKKYGKSKQLRWINNRAIIPIGYVQHEPPKYKRREVNKYLPKYEDAENCTSFEIIKYMMRNAYLYPSIEMADNALSRYIAQHGKCAITHQPLNAGDMECHHIKPVKFGRNDSYENLMLLSVNAHKIITVTKPETIAYYVSIINPTKEMRDKINKLRELQELPKIQFEDYINTTN